MQTVIFSNNSELLRHLSSPPVRRLDLDVIVRSSGDEVITVAREMHPAAAIIDAELPVVSGYDVAKELKQAVPDCRVVLVVGRRLSAEQMRQVSECGCDEILIVPITADQLYDVLAIQLGAARRGSERFAIDLAVITQEGERTVNGRVANLSVDGARLVMADHIAEGADLRLRITPDGNEASPLNLRARVVWAQPRDDSTVVGAAFEEVTEEIRGRLARLTRWEVVEDTERTRIVIKGDITEATNFEDLLPVMVGRVDFDLSQVRYINSLGVRDWIEFLRNAPVQGYEFHACSIAFVLQAAMVKAVLGRGTITSFFAPYHCENCDHEEERLLQSAAVLASEGREPPTFSCPKCDGELALDDIPERYLAFLRDSKRDD